MTKEESGKLAEIFARDLRAKFGRPVPASAEPAVPVEKMPLDQFMALAKDVINEDVTPEERIRLIRVVFGDVLDLVEQEATQPLQEENDALGTRLRTLELQRDRVIKALQAKGVECDAASWDSAVIDLILTPSAPQPAVPSAPVAPASRPIPAVEAVTDAKVPETLTSEEREKQLRKYLEILRANLAVGRRVNERNRAKDFGKDVGDKIQMNQWGFLGTVNHSDGQMHTTLVDCRISTGSTYEYARRIPQDVDLTVLEKALGLPRYILSYAAHALEYAVSSSRRTSVGKSNPEELSSLYKTAGQVWGPELVAACRQIPLVYEDPDLALVDKVIEEFGKIDEEKFVKKMIALGGKK